MISCLETAIEDDNVTACEQVCSNVYLAKELPWSVWKKAVECACSELILNILFDRFSCPPELPHLAAEKGNCYAIRKCHEQHVDLKVHYDDKSWDQRTSLLVAVAKNRILVVLFLLKTNVFTPMDVATAFIVACKYGRTELAEHFLDEHNVPVNVEDEKWGSTGLMHAAQYGRCSTVQMLLRKGADPFMRSRSEAKKTATEFCCSEGDNVKCDSSSQLKICTLLLSKTRKEEPPSTSEEKEPPSTVEENSEEKEPPPSTSEEKEKEPPSTAEEHSEEKEKEPNSEEN